MHSFPTAFFGSNFSKKNQSLSQKIFRAKKDLVLIFGISALLVLASLFSFFLSSSSLSYLPFLLTPTQSSAREICLFFHSKNISAHCYSTLTIPLSEIGELSEVNLEDALQISQNDPRNLPALRSLEKIESLFWAFSSHPFNFNTSPSESLPLKNSSPTRSEFFSHSLFASHPYLFTLLASPLPYERYQAAIVYLPKKTSPEKLFELLPPHLKNTALLPEVSSSYFSPLPFGFLLLALLLILSYFLIEKHALSKILLLPLSLLCLPLLFVPTGILLMGLCFLLFFLLLLHSEDYLKKTRRFISFSSMLRSFFSPSLCVSLVLSELYLFIRLFFDLSFLSFLLFHFFFLCGSILILYTTQNHLKNRTLFFNIELFQFFKKPLPNRKKIFLFGALCLLPLLFFFSTHLRSSSDSSPSSFSFLQPHPKAPLRSPENLFESSPSDSSFFSPRSILLLHELTQTILPWASLSDFSPQSLIFPEKNKQWKRETLSYPIDSKEKIQKKMLVKEEEILFEWNSSSIHAFLNSPASAQSLKSFLGPHLSTFVSAPLVLSSSASFFIGTEIGFFILVLFLFFLNYYKLRK